MVKRKSDYWLSSLIKESNKTVISLNIDVCLYFKNIYVEYWNSATMKELVKHYQILDNVPDKYCKFSMICRVSLLQPNKFIISLLNVAENSWYKYYSQYYLSLK